MDFPNIRGPVAIGVLRGEPGIVGDTAIIRSSLVVTPALVICVCCRLLEVYSRLKLSLRICRPARCIHNARINRAARRIEDYEQVATAGRHESTEKGRSVTTEVEVPTLEDRRARNCPTTNRRLDLPPEGSRHNLRTIIEASVNRERDQSLLVDGRTTDTRIVVGINTSTAARLVSLRREYIGLGRNDHAGSRGR